MIRFKICPRCRGDLYQTQDIFGKFLSCFQCGYLKDIEEVSFRPQPDALPETLIEIEEEKEAA